MSRRLLFFVIASLLLAAPARAQVLAEDGDGALQRENAAEGPQDRMNVPPPPPAGEERTGLLDLFPNLYGSFELRHVIWREMERDAGGIYVTRGPVILNNRRQIYDSPHLEFRPTLGSTFFDGALDTTFTWVFANNMGSNELVKADVINLTQWNIIAGEFNKDSPYSFGPSAFTDFMTPGGSGASFAYTDLGVFGEAIYQFPIATGALSLRGYFNPAVELYSPQQNQSNQSPTVRNNDPAIDAALTDPDTGERHDLIVPQRHPTYLCYYGLGATYHPRRLAGFSVGVGLDFMEYWRPVYRASSSSVDDSPTVSLDHYSPEALSIVRLNLAYKFNDRVSIANQLRHYTGGIFQHGIDTTHPDLTQQVQKVSWENRLGLTINLF